MSRREFKARFQSPVAALMEQFVKEKQACGYRYGEETRILARFDRFLCDEALSQCELPRTMTRKWLAKQSHESAATNGSNLRCSSIRHLYVPAGLLCRCAGAIARGERWQQFLATNPNTGRGAAGAPRR